MIDLMARADPTHLDSASKLNQMDQQSLRAILARAEAMTEQIRRLLASASPEQPRPQAAASSTAEEAPAAAPSLDNPHSPDRDACSPENVSAPDPAAAAVPASDEAKSPASPATTDVPAMTQGEKTPVQGDQSPAAPPPLEESAPPRVGVDTTPTKASALAGNEPVVLLDSHHGDGDDEKALGGENPLELGS